MVERVRIFLDDGMQIAVGTGIGKYSEHLYRSLQKRDDCVVTLDSFQSASKGVWRKLQRLAYLCHINSRSYTRRLGDYDVVHYTNYIMPLRKKKDVCYIVTVHDMTAFLYPKTLSPIYRWYSRLAIAHGIKETDVVLTVSESVQKEIIQQYPMYANKVKVLYPGLYDNDMQPDRSDSFENESLAEMGDYPFFLFIGTIEKRKNLGIMLDAFFRLKQTCPAAKDDKLVLAGRKGFGFDEYKAMFDRSPFGKDVVITGYISDEDCSRLYRKARAYVFPSVYEGFGSPQLECMRFKTPLILSDIPTNREVSKGYGLFFPLGDCAALTAQMKFISEGCYPYKEKTTVAVERLKAFQWDLLIMGYIELLK